MQGADQLAIERPITFSYGFRMRCSACGQASDLTGDDYLRLNQQARARMPCEHCDDQIHFGPLAVDIRDVNDPALDDYLLNRLVWYHTSTYETWPSRDYERDIRATLDNERTRRLLGDPERYIRAQLRKALHLGTYEAAIENMYRRMRDQADERSRFYLHRVRIDLYPDRIERGYRDENDEPAAQLETTELARRGLDAIRYLNAWEAAGCISLAVEPRVISEVRTIPIPAASACEIKDEQVLDLVREVRKSQLDHRENRDLVIYRLFERLQKTLIAAYLPEANPVVAEDFAQAVAGSHDRLRGDPACYARAFAQHAALLTSPGAVIEQVRSSPVRLQ